MGYPNEQMMANNAGYMMGYGDPNMYMGAGYMDPQMSMQRDYNQSFMMKKGHPRNPNSNYQPRGSYNRPKGYPGRRDQRPDGYQKYEDRKYKQGYQYGEEGEDSYQQSKLLPQSRKISKGFPRNPDRRYENPRSGGSYDDQRYQGQDYHRKRPMVDNAFDPKGIFVYEFD